MHNWIMLGSGFLAGVCVVGFALIVRDGSRAERDAKRIEELEADARKYARAWASLAKRGKTRSTLRARLAQMGGNSAA